jgi:hypothetical protein
VRGRSHGGLGCTLHRFNWGVLCAVLAFASALAVTTVARGDSAPVPATAPIPGSDPNHQTPLEQLASRIASQIAGRPVTVNCESAGGWTNIVSAQGGDPNGESGFVATTWNGSTGELLSLSPVGELSPQICYPLQEFAEATVKPTKCLVKNVGLLAGTRRTKAKPKPQQAIVPCYLGAGKTAAPMNAAYWQAYENYSIAILTLAHESIHLSGIVGGTLSNGLAVGDPQAEAKADCYGMQWMPYVAEQLGDTPDDAAAIARFFWDKVYPLDISHPPYWSAQCVPGGGLDLHLPGATSWP